MFEHIYFHGQFRTYQQTILDRADEYLQDGRIHIVAAPGSGKTVLGLELICRLRAPCIILSPTTTIRNQWGERFSESFLGEEKASEYLSYDLTALSPITSVTYQALYSAMTQGKDKEEGTDYTALGLLAEVKRYGIKTVCLDEAHHLQNEWQKALEKFLAALNGEVKIIALTATPPYDTKPNEWKRYIGVCGEIDEEIFVPELVKQGTLCPHQDYLYFNYPTEAETTVFRAYRERALAATDELLSSDLLSKAYGRLLERKEDFDFLYANTKEIVMFLSLCTQANIAVDKKLVRRLTVGSGLPYPTIARISLAVNFLIKGGLLTEEEQTRCLEIFQRRRLTDHGEVSLDLDEKLRKRLLSSVGKLMSIGDIVRGEEDDKKQELRLLILTDHIKKESISLIGSNVRADGVTVVSVFETARKTGVSVGAVSGSLVILPDRCAELLRAQGARVTLSPLGATGYSVYEFCADNREKVRLVSGLFEKGVINVLVGTKSLLGEGWDAPYVNSLILASFVGSFMLSNQMRGRAIRTDKNQPRKTANIWHLVTLERPHLYAKGIVNKISLLASEDKDEILSYDFETVSRRFDCFVAPNYTTGEIESGISRVTILQPPYDEKAIARINQEMLTRSREKENLRSVWQRETKGSARLNAVSEIPKGHKTPPFLFANVAVAVLLFSIFSFCIAGFISTFYHSFLAAQSYRVSIQIVLFVLALVSAVYFGNLLIEKILKHLNPARSVQTFAECILKTMQELKIVSEGAHVKVRSDAHGILILTELLNASVHD